MCVRESATCLCCALFLPPTFECLVRIGPQKLVPDLLKAEIVCLKRLDEIGDGEEGDGEEDEEDGEDEDEDEEEDDTGLPIGLDGGATGCGSHWRHGVMCFGVRVSGMCAWLLGLTCACCVSGVYLLPYRQRR
jgi:hypothetical protein